MRCDKHQVGNRVIQQCFLETLKKDSVPHSVLLCLRFEMCPFTSVADHDETRVGRGHGSKRVYCETRIFLRLKSSYKKHLRLESCKSFREYNVRRCRPNSIHIDKYGQHGRYGTCSYRARN